MMGKVVQLKKPKQKQSRTLGVYKSYVFRDKDPVIDVMRTWVQDSGWSPQKIEAESNVKASTQRAWFKGTTRRPQFCTVAAVAKALGKKQIPLP